MNIYAIRNRNGSPQIIYGDWVKARTIASDGVVRLVKEDQVDDLRFGRVSLEQLPVY